MRQLLGIKTLSDAAWTDTYSRRQMLAEACSGRARKTEALKQRGSRYESGHRTFDLGEIMITEEELKQLEELEREIAPAPWTERVQEGCADWHEIMSAGAPGMDVARVAPWSGCVEANAAFIVAARNLLPRLLEGYRVLEMECASLKAHCGDFAAEINQKDAIIEKMKECLKYYSEVGDA